MPVTFEPLLRFYFFKMLDRSELNFLLIDHLSTCLPVTTRQKSPRGDFAKNGLHWHYLGGWPVKMEIRLNSASAKAGAWLSLATSWS